MNNRKQLAVFIAFCSTQIAAHAQTLTNIAPSALANLASKVPATNTPNALYAMVGQILNNPASLYSIILLCVIAWLADDTPIIPSKYVLHITVVMGASCYWLYTSPDTVPASFKHPVAVFIGNGIICGFVAYVAHRQLVARFTAYWRAHFGQPA